MNQLRCIALLLIVGFLTGCNLQADAPLLDPKKGQAPFGKAFSVMALDAAGNYEIDKKRNVSFAIFDRSDKGIFGAVGPTGDKLRLTFHAIQGHPEFQLLQLYHPKRSSVGYAIGRRFGAHYAVSGLDPDSATIAAAKKNGVIVASKVFSKKIKTRSDLQELARLWIAINAPKLSSLSDFKIKLRIAQSAAERKRMAGVAASLSCLALAGHPEDEAVKKLPGKFKAGIAMIAIDGKRAQTACEKAVRERPTNSIQYSLARVYAHTNQIGKMQTIIDHLLKAGLPLANLMEADTYLRGRGKPKNLDAAKEYFKKSIAGGSTSSMTYYAGQLIAGTFGTPDYAAAEKLLQRAAAMNDPTAYLQLGLNHGYGRGVLVNKDKAFEYYQKCSGMGNGWCKYYAAVSFYNGHGTTKDMKAAYKSFRAAAENGVTEAHYSAGIMLSSGQGTNKDAKAALGQYRKAEKKNHVGARRELGRLTYFGIGTRPDKAKGLRLIKAAAAQKDPAAKKLLKQLADRDKTQKFVLTYGGAKFDFASDVAVLPTGGFIGVGFTRSWGKGKHDGWIFKTGPKGGKIWNKTFGGPDMDLIRRISLLPDGGFIAAGNTKSKGAGHYDLWVQRFDRDGQVLWEKTFGNEREDSARAISLLPGGEIAIVGSTHPSRKDKREAWLVKLDQNGRKLWARTYAIDQYDEGRAIAIRPNGNFVIAGTAAPKAYKTNQAWILELDARGEVLKTKKFAGINYRSIEKLFLSADGSIMAVGNTRRRGALDSDAWVLRLDRDWNVDWNRTFGGSGRDSVYSSAPLPRGELAVAGFTESKGKGRSDVWIAKLNNEGKVVWETTFGTPDYDQAASVQATSDGGIVVAGWTGSGRKKNGFLMTFPPSEMPTGAPKDGPTRSVADIQRDCIEVNKKKKRARIAACSEIVRIRPNDPTAFYNRGLAYKANYDRKNAIADFTDAIKLKPVYADAFFKRGRSHGWKQKDRAIADYGRAIKINPHHVNAIIRRGMTYRFNKQYDLAIKDLETAVTIEPRNWKAYNQLAIAYSRSGNDEQAIANYTKAIEVAPRSTTALRNRAHKFRKMKRFEKSISDYTAAISINSSDHDAFNGRAITYRDLGQFDRALADHTKAISIKPNNSSLYRLRADTYSKAGRKREAEQDRQRAKKIRKEQDAAGWGLLFD